MDAAEIGKFSCLSVFLFRRIYHCCVHLLSCFFARLLRRTLIAYLNMKIAKFSIQNYRCIQDLEVNCLDDKGKVRQWTVLLGENNSGKTNVLRALALLETVEHGFPLNVEATGEKESTVFYAPLAVEHKGQIVGAEHPKVEATLCAEGDLSFQWKYTDQRVSVRPMLNENRLSVFAYGVSRYPAHTALNERESKPYKTLFSTEARLTDLEEWLLKLDYLSRMDDENSRNEGRKRLDSVRRLLKSDLFPEVLDVTFEASGGADSQVIVKFVTKDATVRFEELGFGYQTSLTWLSDFCKRLFELYPESENPLHEEAVVLVDELDLHLHPKWQRDIVPTLSKVFPRVQFIVTTHSPHVLQSMEDVNLYVLKRGEEDGEVAFKHCPRSDFRGWTVEDILSETMGLNEKIHSDYYNQQVEDFNEALDEDNLQRAEKAYEELDRLMNVKDPLRRMFELQIGQLRRRYDQA